MNPYQFEAYCDVCGEGGFTDTRGLAAQFTVGIRHSNPQVCADNLERKRKRLEEREAALKAKEDDCGR